MRENFCNFHTVAMSTERGNSQIIPSNHFGSWFHRIFATWLLFQHCKALMKFCQSLDFISISRIFFHSLSSFFFLHVFCLFFGIFLCFCGSNRHLAKFFWHVFFQTFFTAFIIWIIFAILQKKGKKLIQSKGVPNPQQWGFF